MEQANVRPTLPAVVAAIEGTLHPGAGVPADRPDLHGDLNGLPPALGRAVARIHAAPVPDSAPGFDPLAAIEARLAAGLIDPERLPFPYRRYTPRQLVDRFRRAPTTPVSTPVCCVGNLTIQRLLLDGGALVGIAGGPFGIVADRHADLAVVQQSILGALGGEAVFGFYDAYGTPPNIVELDRWMMAGQLLGWLS